jgi:hypothetical protein
MTRWNVQAKSKCSRTLGRRAINLMAMLMIGDGMLAMLMPQRHARTWEKGPHLWEIIMRYFIKRPELTRWLGAVELATGVWLAQQLKNEPDSDEFKDIT